MCARACLFLIIMDSLLFLSMCVHLHIILYSVPVLKSGTDLFLRPQRDVQVV